MEQCYNRGCGKTFDPEKNDDESCRHHPGAPFFHDAYKGWSCCNKKSVDFTEFLSIKGCTLSKHSNVKPPEPEKPPKEENDVLDKDEVIEVRAPIRAALERPSIALPLQKVQATVAPALKEAIDGLRTKAPTEAAPAEVNKLAAGEIAAGTVCKNSGCTYAYIGPASDVHECQYHPGVPIFHEGLKFWSCCQKRTSDFAVFMAQRGCTYGQHKWFKENEDKKVVECRYDWHQTATNVIVSIYAKMYHYADSLIEINPIRLHVNLVFPEQENAKYDLDLELRGIIDVSKTTAHMYSSKIEITMPKAEPGSWAKLDFPNAKLPPPTAARTSVDDAESGQSKPRRDTNSDDDDDFNLDDIETANTGLRLAEISNERTNNLD